MNGGQDIWEAWAAGRYLIGAVLTLVLGLGPLVEGYWLGLVPLMLGVVLMLTTYRRQRGLSGKASRR